MATMPTFVFERRRDIELEAGFILAGHLVVDIPKRPKLKTRQKRMITEIVQQLTKMAQSAQMPDDALVYGWPGGRRPPDADDIIDDDALMASWASRSVVIGIRIDPRNDGLIRVDSDVMRQAGLIPDQTGQA